MTKKKEAKSKISTKNGDIFRIQPNELQKQVINFIRTNEITLLSGESGTGKDTCCLFRGLDGLIKKEFEKMLIIRPIVESSSSKLGFLKGDLSEKTNPYEQFYFDHLNKMLNKVELTRVKSKIEFEVCNFVRGKSFEYSYIIVSEAQSFRLEELMTIVTRLSSSSKIVFNFDPMQSDIGNKSGIKDFIKILEGVDGADYMHLGAEYQMRNPMIVQINKNYRDFLASK